jgi:hypothetical protein
MDINNKEINKNNKIQLAEKVETIATNVNFYKIIEKRLTIIAILLLVLILLQLPGFSQLLSHIKQSEECILARQLAVSSSQLNLNFMDDYEDTVYGPGVDNINQQIFRVSEYQYMALEKLALHQQALLRVITECEW